MARGVVLSGAGGRFLCLCAAAGFAAGLAGGRALVVFWCRLGRRLCVGAGLVFWPLGGCVSRVAPLFPGAAALPHHLNYKKLSLSTRESVANITFIGTWSYSFIR